MKGVRLGLLFLDCPSRLMSLHVWLATLCVHNKKEITPNQKNKAIETV